ERHAWASRECGRGGRSLPAPESSIRTSGLPGCHVCLPASLTSLRPLRATGFIYPWLFSGGSTRSAVSPLTGESDINHRGNAGRFFRSGSHPRCCPLWRTSGKRKEKRKTPIAGTCKPWSFAYITIQGDHVHSRRVLCRLVSDEEPWPWRKVTHIASA